ncbi:MAG TPA: histidine kinase dimerization/phospho-acceptor domain-containing protein [Pyrinomonadaceae bacterium]|nr:histidine kinase dimerization/phospho-acceptor domain-containing protein [Pyrinomonadaceae bacterium]
MKLGATMTETDEQSLAGDAESTTSLVNQSERDNQSERNTLQGSDGDEKLRALAAEYEAKMDEVADLITRVRHEINNPLTGVLGQAQLLLREELSERAKKRAETIEALAIRIRDIVAQLRQVQKTSKG